MKAETAAKVNSRPAENLGSILLCLALTAFAAALIVCPERYVNCCLEGFALWAECVLPSLFPFMAVNLLFIKTGLADRASLPLVRVTRALNMPSSAAVCFILSICSGYPAGSRIISEFHEAGALSPRDCDKLAPLCSTSGPLFIIGSVGLKMFGDKALGFKLLAAHAVAVIAVSLVRCLLSKKSEPLPPRPVKATAGNALYESFYGATVSVAVAGGFIAFFYVVGQLAADFNILLPLKKLLTLFLDPASADALCLGLIEATSGCRALAASGSPYSGALAGFIVTFGGVSILAQQLCYLTKAGVSVPKFVLLKFVQALLCALIMFLISL